MKNHPIRVVGILLGLLLGAVPMAHAGAGLNVTFTSKIFGPAAIAPNGTSTLTLTFTNATGVLINGVTFIDTFPAGMTFVNFGSPTFSPGCAPLSSISNSNPASFSGSLNVSPNTFCAVSVVVTVGAPGVYTNSTSNISGWNGLALGFAPAALTVGSTAVPTLSEFALILLALGLALLAYRMRFRRARSGADPPA